MRAAVNAVCLLCGALAVIGAGVATAVLTAPVQAEDRAPSSLPATVPPAASEAAAKPSAGGSDQPMIRPLLDRRDEIAALEALQIALSEVGDGAAYIWHAKNGRISGVVKPTESFRNTGGSVCRRVEVVMTAGGYSRETRGVACRLPDGAWQLSG